MLVLTLPVIVGLKFYYFIDRSIDRGIDRGIDRSIDHKAYKGMLLYLWHSQQLLASNPALTGVVFLLDFV